MREQRYERFQAPRPSWMMPKPTPIYPAYLAPPVSTTPEAEPMLLGLVRAPLTTEERLRRRQGNLCLYCGGSGHFLRSCPVRPSKSYPQSTINHQVSGFSQTYVTLFVSLQLPEKEAHLPAIVDSGACSCFLDASLTASLHIPLITKRRSLQVHLADGSLPYSGLITQKTRPILTTTDSGHQEYLRFDIISSMFPIILGLPWLQAHETQIDWNKKEVLFSSQYCTQHCLLPAPASCSTIASISDNLQHVPTVYLEFKYVFDKQKADRLPPHHSYDCPIDLLPGSEIPFGRIFPLSETELKALKSYID